MKISIIIPTINRTEDLINTIHDLGNQNHQDFEIIVIDQSKKESKELLIHLHPSISYYHVSFKSASKARNFGIQKAQGEILLFIDDDVSIEDPQFLDFHLSNYVDSNIHGVVGQVLDRSKSERNFRHKCSNHPEYGWLFFPLNFNKKAFLKSGASCNMSVRRLSTIEVGGMNEQYEKGAHREESDFTYRLCKKYGPMIFDPNASLIHLQTPSGGIRNWNDQKFNVKAQQHFSGAIYFNLQSVSWKYQPIHWIVTIRYLFWRKELVSNPRLLALSMLRFLIGFYQAIVYKIKGPKYLHS